MAKQVSIHLVYPAVTNSINQLVYLITAIAANRGCTDINFSNENTDEMPSLDVDIVLDTIEVKDAYAALMAAINDVFRDGMYTFFKFSSQDLRDLSNEVSQEEQPLRTFELTDEDKIFVRNEIFGRSNGDKK